MKKILFKIVTVLVFVLPVSVSAATLTESQVNSILNLLREFGADSSVINNVSTSLVGANSGSVGTGTEGLRSYRSYPVVSQFLLPPNIPNGDLELYRFSVAASPSGSISLGKVSFSFDTDNLSISNVSLLGQSGRVSQSAPISFPESQNGQFSFVFDSQLNTDDRYIGAGYAKSYSLRGRVNAVNPINNSKLNLTLLGDDNSSPILLPLNSVNGNFIWSPNSTTTFVTHANSDWTNGSSVRGLPSIGLRQSFTINSLINSAPPIASTTPTSPSSPTVPVTSPTSTSPIQPTEVKVSIGVNKPFFVPGETILVNFNNPNVTYAKDWIAIVKREGSWGSYPSEGQEKTWTYTNGVKSGEKKLIAPNAGGEYDIVYFVDNGYKELSRIHFTVGDASSFINLSLNKDSYGTGENISVNFTNSGKTYAKDWIGIVKAGESWGSATNEGQGKTWVYTDGSQSGTKTLVAPKEPGIYEIVYFVDNGYKVLKKVQFAVSLVNASMLQASLPNAFSLVNYENDFMEKRTIFPFQEDLWRGNRGGTVRFLQEVLKREGVFNYEITGEFYDFTYDAVKAFQRKYGLNETGYVGISTREKLNELYGR